MWTLQFKKPNRRGIKDFVALERGKIPLFSTLKEARKACHIDEEVIRVKVEIEEEF